MTHLVRVRVWVRVSFGVGGGQFSSGAIVLEPILSALVADVLINIKLIYCYKIQVFKCIIVDSETSRKPLISLMHNARESSDTL